MAINLDPASAHGAPLGGRLDRHDAQARQDRWMFELERAMFSSSAKKDAGAQPEQGRAAAQERQGVAVADPLRAAPLADPARATAPSAAAPVHSHAADGVASVKARTQDDAAAPSAAAVLGAAAASGGTSVAAVASAAGAEWHVHGAALFQAVDCHGANGSAMPTVAALLNAGGARLPVAAAAAGEASKQGVAPAGRSPNAAMRLPVLPVQEVAPAADAPSLELASDAEAAQAAASADTPLGEAAQFEQRLMHLYVKDDAVHAFIRDAGLDAAQMRAVAQAMAAEVAAGGQTLAALTVNGKAVAPHPAVLTDAGEQLSLPGGKRNAQAPFPLSPTPVRKGNF